jgi:hypothetical protein
MNPLFIVLYAVIVTLVLTVLFPRLRTANPRLSWLLMIAGVVGLFIIIVLALTR